MDPLPASPIQMGLPGSLDQVIEIRAISDECVSLGAIRLQFKLLLFTLV